MPTRKIGVKDVDIQLMPEQIKWLDKLAKKENESRSAAVRRILKEAMAKN